MAEGGYHERELLSGRHACSAADQLDESEGGMCHVNAVEEVVVRHLPVPAPHLRNTPLPVTCNTLGLHSQQVHPQYTAATATCRYSML